MELGHGSTINGSSTSSSSFGDLWAAATIIGNNDSEQQAPASQNETRFIRSFSYFTGPPQNDCLWSQSEEPSSSSSSLPESFNYQQYYYLNELIKEKFNDATVIISVIILVLINIVVIFGNILVILSVFATAKLRTVTNFFIVSLAVADFLVGIAVLPYSLTFEILDTWIFGEVWCKGWLVIDVWMCTASILNLCAISVDRYLAVTRPVRYRSLMTAKRAKFIIAGVWIISFIICFPPLLIGNNETFSSATTFKSSMIHGDIVGSRPGLFDLPNDDGVSSVKDLPLTTYQQKFSPTPISIRSTDPPPPRLDHSTKMVNSKNSLSSLMRVLIPTTDNDIGRDYLTPNDDFDNDDDDDGKNFLVKKRDLESFSSTSESPPDDNDDDDDDTDESPVRPTIQTETRPINHKPQCKPQPVQCALFRNKSYVIYSALGSFFIPMFVMIFFYWRIYLVAIRTSRALKRGYRVTKSSTSETNKNQERLTLRIHRGYAAEEHHHHQHHQHHHQQQQSNSDKGMDKNLLRPTTYFKRTDSTRSSWTSQKSASNLTETALVDNSSNENRSGNKLLLPSGGDVHVPVTATTNATSNGKTTTSIRRHSSGCQSNISLPMGGGSGGGSTPGSREGSARIVNTGKMASRAASKRTSKYQAKRFQAETKAAKTVGIIVGGFIVCWLPFFTVYLARAFCDDCIPDLLFSIFFWLGYCNSMINPCIYGLFSRDFRRAFKNIICRCRFREETSVSSLIRQIHMPTFFEDMPEEMMMAKNESQDY